LTAELRFVVHEEYEHEFVRGVDLLYRTTKPQRREVLHVMRQPVREPKLGEYYSMEDRIAACEFLIREGSTKDENITLLEPRFQACDDIEIQLMLEWFPCGKKSHFVYRNPWNPEPTSPSMRRQPHHDDTQLCMRWFSAHHEGPLNRQSSARCSRNQG
jgi:hypothetical protein